MPGVHRFGRFSAPLALIVAGATGLSVISGVMVTRAQDEVDAPHPVHIHTGTCDNLGDVVVPLTDIKLNTAGESFGLPSAVPVEQSETDVAISMSDLLASPHAINAHESADAIQNYIACGDIGGRVVDGDLLIGLREINSSGHSGIARLETDDDGVEVYLYLAEDMTEAPSDAPAASDAAPADATQAPAADATQAPADDAAAATDDAAATEEAAATDDVAVDDAAAVVEEAPVDIRDFAFSPNPIEVAVGGTITWTNQDGVPHTTTAELREVMQSGAISPGTSFSQTFDTAGEFPYFCEFHPNMQGSIVVQ